MVNMLGARRWQGLISLALVGCASGDLLAPSTSDHDTGGGEATHTSALTEQRIAQRRKLTASRKLLRPAIAPRDLRTADATWTDALDVTDAVESATLDGDPRAAQVRGELGVIKPLRGGSFVLLSTGLAGAGANGLDPPEPGTDLGDPGEPGDATSLQLVLRVPPGANAVSFQYNFLSTEYPEFVGTLFNDTFSVSVQTDPLATPTSFPIATVNSSTFFAVSDARAKGAGFDIYSADPSDVDFLPFETGLPDAGLTDFHSFSIPIAPNTPELTLTFTIQDAGDGILDSAVLLDAVQFSALEPIDPNPDLETPAGTLTSTIDDLATLGRPVRGVAADGATDLLLRVKLPGPGSVAFSVPSATATADGALSTLGGNEQAQTVTSDSVLTTANASYAFAVYRAPADFNTGSDDQAIERAVAVTAVFTPAAGAGFTSQIDLQIKRPPLVVARGLWSGNLSWTPLIAHDPAFFTDDPRFAITYADRAYACDAELRIVPPPPDDSQCPWTRTAPPDGEVLCGPEPDNMFTQPIREALANARRLNIAATKVDVVAQADTGLHAREYINAPGYRNPTNLNAGDVNRLITLNTPHLGSVVADAIVAARDVSGAPGEDFMCRAHLIETLGDPPGGVAPGDIDTLTTTRVALAQTDVHGHALVSSSGKTLSTLQYKARVSVLSLTLADTFNATAVQIVPQCATSQPRCTSVWGPGNNQIDHDTFSSVVSQTGGMTTATTAIPTTKDPAQTDGWTDFLHANRSELVSTQLINLLNTAVGTSTFAPFPATGAQPHAVAAIRSPTALAAPSGSLRIVSPVNGDEVFAGDTVSVQVVADGFSPTSIAAVLGDAFAEADTAPFTLSVTVPAHALGPTRLLAIGTDADDRSLLSNLVTLDVRTRATLTAIRTITQDPFLFGIGKHHGLVVVGDYDDGVTRDITSPAAGTVYLTSNPAVVTVSPGGVLTSVAPGIATVAIQNAGRQDSITVTVTANAAPIANAGADVSAVCALPGATVSVHLDGSASIDPDGDPLTYTWFEGGIQIATGPTPSIQLAVGIHTITLVVSDGGSSAEASITVSVTTDNEPPRITILGNNPANVECGTPYADAGATAFDQCDGSLTSSIATTSNVNTRVPGSYAVSYAVSDRAQLTATATRSVVVADHTPPVVHAKPMIELFPPDLHYRELDLSDCAEAFDTCGGKVNLDRNGEIIAIHSDEPDVLFRHDPDHDIVILGPSSFLLRSQRDARRNGRVYEVEFRAHDQFGNWTPSHSCFIGVKLHAHSGPPIDDGRIFTVRPRGYREERGQTAYSHPRAF